MQGPCRDNQGAAAKSSPVHPSARLGTRRKGTLVKMESSYRSIPSYLGLSIFNMLCCCFPLGVAALICSCRVQDATSSGNMELASSSSRSARILNIVGIVLGVIMLIIVGVYVGVVMPRKIH